MPYYTKKLVVIEARQYLGTPESAEEIIQWARSYNITIALWLADPGDYIIRGMENEFYSVKRKNFERDYLGLQETPTSTL